MNIKVLTKELIYLIHADVIEHYGGSPGGYDNTDGKLESILAQQYPFFGHEQYPTVFEKAAMLLYFFAKGHCFRDGNKRLALQAAIVFLKINGFEDMLPQHEAYMKVNAVAESHISEENRAEYIQGITNWLRSRFIRHKGLY
jgi:death-on-curing protein